MSTLEKHDRLSFGLFEVDLEAGELWRGGHKIRLTGQPFKVLTILAARPGEVVSRDELQEKVWGTNTTVDFERAVAGAINKVREALCDSAENPRFIQTLPKRGYRFIAPVSLVHTVPKFALGGEPPHDAVIDGAAPSSTPITKTLVAPAHPPDIEDVSKPRPSLVTQRAETILPGRALLLGIIVALLLCLALVLFLWKTQKENAPLRIDQLTRGGAISAGPPNVENLLTLATDGNRILTSVMAEGQARLSAISIGTGEVQPLSLPQELASSLLADISRDGSKLLLKGHLSSASEQPLWIVPSSGGSGLRVGSVLAHDAAWMPDGSSILYANGNDLAIIRLDNGVSMPFARLPGRAFWMRWSPDGKLLRFTLQDPVAHSSGIWELSADGGVPRRIATPGGNSASACCGTWTSDGRAYVFQSADNLWKLTGSGRFANFSQLTNGPLRFSSPVTARGGSRIFFMGLDQPAGMQMFDDLRGFQAAPAFLADATRVDFSHDGTWVAWTDHDSKLWRARSIDGSDKVQLTPAWLDVFLAHWSPNGKQLAVMAREPGKVWKLYLVDADGGTPLPLLKEDRNAADPGWSADGNDLVFGREPDLMGKESGSHNIQIIHLATMQTETVQGSEGMFSPRWSPDGRWIVTLSLNQKSIWIYDVAQKHWKELAETSAADPVWSSDSQAVYVHAFLQDKQPILKVGVPNGNLQVIADLGSFHDRTTMNYFFGGLTPANEPLVQPRIGTGDLYTLDLRSR